MRILLLLKQLGVYGEANYNNSVKDNYGIYGVAKNNNAGNNIGGYFEGTSSVGKNTGVRAYAFNANQSNIAGDFQAISSVSGPFATIYNIAVRALSFGPNPIPNMAVYGEVDNATRPQDYAGYFEGNLYVNGPLNGGAGCPSVSDQMFKTDLDTIHDANHLIDLIKPKSFFYDTMNTYGVKFSSKKQYGFIAQEIETILPELVGSATKPAKFDSLGNVIIPSVSYKTLNYDGFIAIIVKALQQQKSTIDSLTTKLNSKDSLQDARLTALENAITQCCSNNSARQSNSSINQLDIELSDKDAVVLYQNLPNPFSEETTITYNIPSSVSKAQLIFFNTNGQVIQTVDIKTRGKGKVNVFASDLSSGLYNYSLVADGKVIDSKKMVRE